MVAPFVEFALKQAPTSIEIPAAQVNYASDARTEGLWAGHPESRSWDFSSTMEIRGQSELGTEGKRG